MDMVLIKDLVIPAGTVFGEAATHTARLGDGHIEATIGLTGNTSGSVHYYTGDDQEELREWFRELR